MSESKISDESKILLLLCSYLGLGRNSEANLTPFTPVAWHKIRNSIPDDEILSLFELSSTQISEKFEMSENDSYRIEMLLKRGWHLSNELKEIDSNGIWVITEFDEDYPARFREKLNDKAPPVIFGAGDKSLLNEGGVAIVGSRDVDGRGESFTKELAEQCANEKLTVISGGARGVDQIAMASALKESGKVIGVLADSLEKSLQSKGNREIVLDGNLTLITHQNPSAGFSIGEAMARNKLVYSLADYAVVVSSSLAKGGTWVGATEALQHNYARVFARDSDSGNIPDGNKALIKNGAIPIPEILDFNLPEFFKNSVGVNLDIGDNREPSTVSENKKTAKSSRGRKKIYPEQQKLPLG